MRFNIDLLPNEYKSFQRNLVVLALAAFTVIASCTAIGMMVVRNGRELSARKAERDGKEAQKLALIAEQNKEKARYPVADANDLKERIQFINANLGTPGSSWVAFLSALEQTVPDRVWIRTLTETGPDSYRIEGESEDIGQLLTFIDRMQRSGQFTNVFPLSNSTVIRDGVRVTGYTLTFQFKGRKP